MTDFARHACHLGREGAELLDHGVERVLEQQDLAADVDRDLLGQVTAGDRGGDLGDVAHLGGQVRGHEVDVVGEILPGAGNLRHLGLAAELALGANLARHARHFGGEGIELVDHRVDGVLQLENLALDVDCDLFGKVAFRHRCGHLGDVAHLAGEVAGHRVDVVGQILPGAGDPGDVGLAAQPSLGADLARHPRHLTGEPVELIDHGVQRFLELQDLAAHVDRDLARQVAAGDGGRHLGDVTDLGGQIAGHRIDAVGEVFPGTGHPGHLGLTAELAVGADFASDARHLAGEGVELVDHRVQGFLELQDFARHVHRDLFRQVALGDRRCDLGDVSDLAGQVARHRVDAVGQILPGAGDATHQRLAAELAFSTDLAGDARHFAGEGVELVDHGVDGIFQLENFAADVDRDLFREVAIGDCGGHLGDVAHLGGQVARHRVDALGQVLPGAGDAKHVGLAAQPAVGAHLARHARHFAGKGVELVDHRIQRFLELEDFAGHVYRDLLGKVAARDRGGDIGDVAHLGGEVRGHEVDVVGEILPGAGDAGDLGLTAELAFGADLARHARHFRRERIELVDHRVDGVLQLQNLAAHVHRDLAREVATGDRGGHVGDIAHLGGEVAAHRIDGIGEVLPGAGDAGHDRLAAELAVGSNLAGDAGHFRCKRAQLVHHGVDGFLQLQNLAANVDCDFLGKVAIGHRNGDFSDVANLAGEVVGHGVDAFGQVLPHPRHFGDLGLAAELAFGSDLARDARHLRREHAELLDHRVDDIGRLQEFAAQRAAVDVELHGLQQVTLRNRGDRAGHFAGRPEQIVDQRVDGALHVGP